MKTKPTFLLLSAAVVGLIMAAAPRAVAVNGTYNSTSSGNWSDATKWSGGIIANGSGSYAQISANITAGRTVTVDIPVTVGRIRFNDTTSSDSWSLSSSGSGTFLLETNGSIPVIDANNQTATINLALTGIQGFIKVGGGTLALNNAANSNGFSGKISVTNGTLRVSSEPCLGAYPSSYTADQITLDGPGGVLMQNNTELTLSENNGITVTTRGGAIQSGWGKAININCVIAGASSGPLTFRTDSTPGEVRLNANNTYTGPTIISQLAGTTGTSWATVLVNGSLASSSVQVKTNGFLGGIGTISGPVGVGDMAVIGGGAYWTPGTLTINNSLSLTNAIIKADLALATTTGAGVNDLLQVNGNLTLTGTITVSVNALQTKLTSGGTYRLINCTGTLDASGATIVTDNPRLNATFSTSSGGLDITIGNGDLTPIVWSGVVDNVWDVNSTLNFLDGTNQVGFVQGEPVVFDNSGNYGSPVTMQTVGGIGNSTIQPAYIKVEADSDIVLTNTGNARLGGGMALYKGGSGILTFGIGSASSPNTYTGPNIVTNGTLRLGGTAAITLGATNGPTIVTNLGRFDTAGRGDIYEDMYLQGSGPDGFGVVMNSRGSTANNGLRGLVTFLGDVTLGSSNRFDIYGGTLTGNGYKLTKKGPAEIALANLKETGLGDIDVDEGTLTFLGSTTAGNPGTRMAVWPNAAVILYNLNNTPTNPLVRNITLTNASFRSNSGTNYHAGTITLDGTNNINASSGFMTLQGPVVGSSAVRKGGDSTSTLILEGTNTYNGATFVDAGTLALGTNGSIANSPLINLATGTTLDVSQAGSLTLASGQTLSGVGTVLGDLTAGSGTTLIPGSSPGTLTVQGKLNLSGATMNFELGSSAITPGLNDQIVAYGVSPSGMNTIKILPLSALETNNAYTLILNNGPTYMPSGSEANFQVLTDSRYNFTILPTDSYGTPGGALQVQVAGAASAATLTWQGNDSVSPTLWDLKTTANWLNGATVDKFYAGDTVIFDDVSAIGTTANLVGLVQPGAVLASNLSKTITIGGSGSLVAPSMEIGGGGALRLANSAANQVLNGVTIDSGTLVVASTANNDFGTGINLVSNPGSTVVFDQAQDTTVAAPLQGSGTMRKENTNTLTMTAMSGGSNPIILNNGVLKAGSDFIFGDVNTPLTINSGATLDFYGYAFTNKIIKVAGAGYNGQGAIINSQAAAATTATSHANWNTLNIIMTGDTTFGGPAVWDLRGQGQTGTAATLGTDGGNYKLTKIGTPTHRWSIVNTIVDTNLGDIDIQGGIVSYEENTTGLGNPTNTIFVRSNAFLTFYRASVPLNKNVTVDDGGIIRAGSGVNPSNLITGPVYLSGGVGNLGAASSVTLDLLGPITGPGGFNKIEAGTVTLSASNNFAGNVDVIQGVLVLSNSYALGTNKTVSVLWNPLNGTGGNGTRLTLKGDITTPADVAAVFSSTASPTDQRVSMNSDVNTNTWAGPIVLEGDNIIGFYRNGATSQLNITGDLHGTNGFTGQAFFRGTAGYGGEISGKLDLPTGRVSITDGGQFLFSNPNNVFATNSTVYGKFILGADNAGCATASIVLGQSGNDGIFDLNGFNQTFPSVSCYAPRNHAFTNGSATADSVLTYNGGANNSIFNGRIVDGIRKLSLTVTSGTLNLMSNNTYKGSTLINGGRLAFGPFGTLTASPLVSIASGAVLDSSAKAAPGLAFGAGQTITGPGTVEGSLSIGSGANFAASGVVTGSVSIASGGSFTGTASVSDSLSVAAGGTFSAGSNGVIAAITVGNGAILAGTCAVDVNAGTCDVVNAASISYSGVLTVNNLGPAFALGNTFKLFNAPLVTGAFTSIVPAAPGFGLRWDTSTLNIDGTLRIAPVALDQPTVGITPITGGMTITWPADHLGWQLEYQYNGIDIGISNNWSAVPGSKNTNSISINYSTSPSAFFRLHYPWPQ